MWKSRSRSHHLANITVMATKKKPDMYPHGLAVIADCHIGNLSAWGGPVGPNGLNRRGELTVATLRRACARAVELNCDTLFVAGDMFHNRRPEPAVIAAVQAVFSEAYGVGLKIIIVPGNHDMMDASAEGGNTACAPLWECATVVLAPRTERGVFLVPYDSRVPMAQHLTEVLANKKLGAQVLVTHVGVWDDLDAKASPWYRKAKDGMHTSLLFDAMEDAGITMAFVGNYHQHRVWKRGSLTIVQVGTLCPGGFGDGGIVDRGLLAQCCEGVFSMHEIPGPRFITWDGTSDAGKGERKNAENTYFGRQVGGVELSEVAKGYMGGYEYIPAQDNETQGTPAEDYGGDSPDEALAAYVEGMDLPAGVDKAAVLEMVKDCWKKAG